VQKPIYADDHVARYFLTPCGNLSAFLTNANFAQETSRSLSMAEGLNDEKICHVLVVDDETDTVIEICDLLASAGHHAIGAGSADDALRHVSTNPRIDVVLTDLRMPNTDGLVLVRMLSEMPMSGPRPFVIMMTGHAGAPEKVTAAQHGVMQFLIKPLDPQDLLAAVARACQSRNRHP
jgi:DNA-binding NtrC family response regulator